MANRFPLIINSGSSQIQELANADNLDLTGCGILNSSATITLPTSTGTLATLAGTETFTNKTLTSPTLTTPALGTPSSGTLTSCTGLPLTSGVTGTLPVANGGTGVTSSTGSGANVLGTAPVLTNASLSNVFITGAREFVTVSATAANSSVVFDYLTQAVLYYTSNASANWSINIRGNSGTTLNSVMSTGDAITVAFIVPQGGTAYYNTSVQVDGTTSGVTTTWQGGAPTKGNASGQDHYTYTIIKTASATFTVFAVQTQFKA
jgi:hypothetical protein